MPTLEQVKDAIRADCNSSHCLFKQIVDESEGGFNGSLCYGEHTNCPVMSRAVNVINCSPKSLTREYVLHKMKFYLGTLLGFDPGSGPVHQVLEQQDFGFDRSFEENYSTEISVHELYEKVRVNFEGKRKPIQDMLRGVSTRSGPYSSERNGVMPSNWFG